MREAFCYLDKVDPSKLRVFRQYCKRCRERTPQILCLSRESRLKKILICQMCRKESIITLEQHDRVLAGKDYDKI